MKMLEKLLNCYRIAHPYIKILLAREPHFVHMNYHIISENVSKHQIQ